VNPSGRVDKLQMITPIYTGNYITSILQNVNTIAMAGTSPKPHRTSHKVTRFLQKYSYRIIPTNTRDKDFFINGKRVYNTLDNIDNGFQMVSILRKIEGVIEITNRVINLSKKKSSKPSGCNSKFKIV
jgi:predicted CoA-binding protein